MPDDTKGNDRPASSPPAARGQTPPAEKPAAAPAKAAEKPAAEAPKMAATPWDCDMVARLRRRYGSGIREAATYAGQDFLVAEASVAFDVLRSLRDEEQFDYCVDVTAVHWPERQRPFEVVWVLYSFPRNERVRVKAEFAEDEQPQSAVDLWPTANWLEREVFDMFGIRFAGHPDMRRILLPEEWKGYPLRKDYGIIQQDQEWVQINLGIESGQ
jgi:NADH-quinone oxidoreductase subunit C